MRSISAGAALHSGSTLSFQQADTARCRDLSGPTPTRARDFGADPATHSRSTCFFQWTDNTARSRDFSRPTPTQARDDRADTGTHDEFSVFFPAARRSSGP